MCSPTFVPLTSIRIPQSPGSTEALRRRHLQRCMRQGYMKRWMTVDDWNRSHGAGTVARRTFVMCHVGRQKKQQTPRTVFDSSVVLQKSNGSVEPLQGGLSMLQKTPQVRGRPLDRNKIESIGNIATQVEFPPSANQPGDLCEFAASSPRVEQPPLQYWRGYLQLSQSGKTEAVREYFMPRDLTTIESGGRRISGTS